MVDGRIQGDGQTIANPLVVNKLTDQIHKANLAIDYFYDKPALKEAGLDWYPKNLMVMAILLILVSKVSLAKIPKWRSMFMIFLAKCTGKKPQPQCMILGMTLIDLMDRTSMIC